MFMTSSMKATIQLGKEFGDLQKHKIREYWECVQRSSKIHPRIFRRNSECERPGIFLTFLDEVLTNDQAIKWAKARVCVYADSVLNVQRWDTLQKQLKHGKVQWQDSGDIHHIKMQLVLMEKQLNSSGQFFTGCSSLSIVEEIPQDLETWRIQPEEFEDRIIFMSMFNDIEWNTSD